MPVFLTMSTVSKYLIISTLPLSLQCDGICFAWGMKRQFFLLQRSFTLRFDQFILKLILNSFPKKGRADSLIPIAIKWENVLPGLLTDFLVKKKSSVVLRRHSCLGLFGCEPINKAWGEKYKEGAHVHKCTHTYTHVPWSVEDRTDIVSQATSLFFFFLTCWLHVQVDSFLLPITKQYKSFKKTVQIALIPSLKRTKM